MKFTEDWFTVHIPTWEKYVLPRLRNHPARMVEIGSFEGRAAVWLLQNALTEPTDVLVCIDLFTSHEGHDDYEKTFDANLRELAPRAQVHKMRAPSRDALPTLLPTFDGVYIDGSHATIDVLRDAVLAFDIVKPGGFILFDDYDYAPDPDHVVSDAVDHFVSVYYRCLKTVFSTRQYMVERIR
ncbi:MAG: class I SAM-dependent methyltransferase [Candidatus Eremiobacteraeota bacterium]|nr:class I SAM-dependent methyltransferase [Candidatus Eremiobacteraeota bacterium]